MQASPLLAPLFTGVTDALTSAGGQPSAAHRVGAASFDSDMSGGPSPLLSSAALPSPPLSSAALPSPPLSSGVRGKEFGTLLGVARELRAGLDIRDRYSRFKLYPNCFVGSDAVSWLAGSQYCASHTRQEAVVMGKKLLHAGFFHHVSAVSDDHDFGDKSSLYRYFVDEDRLYKAFWSDGSHKSPLISNDTVIVEQLLDSIHKQYEIPAEVMERCRLRASADQRARCLNELQALADVWAAVIDSHEKQIAVQPSQWRLQPHVVCNSALLTVDMADSLHGASQAMASCLRAQADIIRKVTELMIAVGPEVHLPAILANFAEQDAVGKGIAEGTGDQRVQTDVRSGKGAARATAGAQLRARQGPQISGIEAPDLISPSATTGSTTTNTFDSSPTLAFIPMMKRVLLGSRPSHAARMKSQPAIPEASPITIPVPATPPPPPQSLLDNSQAQHGAGPAVPLENSSMGTLEPSIAYEYVRVLLNRMAALRVRHAKLAKQLLRGLRETRRIMRELSLGSKYRWMPSIPRMSADMHVFKLDDSSVYSCYKTVFVVAAAPKVVLKHIVDCHTRMMWDPGFASGVVVCGVDAGAPIDIGILRSQSVFVRNPEQVSIAPDDMTVSTGSTQHLSAVRSGTYQPASSTGTAAAMFAEPLRRSATNTLIYSRPLARGEQLPATRGTPGICSIVENYFPANTSIFSSVLTPSPRYGAATLLSTSHQPTTLHLTSPSPSSVSKRSAVDLSASSPKDDRSIGAASRAGHGTSPDVGSVRSQYSSAARPRSIKASSASGASPRTQSGATSSSELADYLVARSLSSGYSHFAPEAHDECIGGDTTPKLAPPPVGMAGKQDGEPLRVEHMLSPLAREALTEGDALPSGAVFPRVMYRQLDMRRVSSLMAPRDCVILQDVGVWPDGTVVIYEVSVQHREVPQTSDAVRAEVFVEAYALEPFRVPESMFGSSDAPAKVRSVAAVDATEFGTSADGASWKSNPLRRSTNHDSTNSRSVEASSISAPKHSNTYASGSTASSEPMRTQKEGIFTFTKVTRLAQVSLRGQVPPWLNGAVVDMLTIVPMRGLRDLIRKNVPCPAIFDQLAQRLLQASDNSAAAVANKKVAPPPRKIISPPNTPAHVASLATSMVPPLSMDPDARLRAKDFHAKHPLLTEASSSSLGRVLDIVKAGQLARQRASSSLLSAAGGLFILSGAKATAKIKASATATHSNILTLSRLFADSDSESDDDDEGHHSPLSESGLAPAALAAVLAAEAKGNIEEASSIVASQAASGPDDVADARGEASEDDVDEAVANDFSDIPVDFSLEDVINDHKSAVDSAADSIAISNASSFERGSVVEAKVGLIDFELLAVLGRGGYGKVMLVRRIMRPSEAGAVRHRANDVGCVFAMKVLRKKELIRRKQVSRTITERLILSKIRHPFIVSLHHAFQTKAKLYMVMDYVPGGDFFSLLSRDGAIGEERVVLYIAEMVSAIEHLHKHGVVYRDLKPENILLDADGHIKLTDFGLSRYINKEGTVMDASQESYSFCGTEQYMPPEMLLQNGHNEVADWWTLGIVLSELLTGKHPFRGPTHLQTLRNIVNPEYAPTTINSMSTVAASLALGLLEKSPHKRLGSQRTGGIDGLKAHPFFRYRPSPGAPPEKLDWEKVYRREYRPMARPKPRADSVDVSNFDEAFTREAPIDSLASGATFRLRDNGQANNATLQLAKSPSVTTFSAFSYSRTSNSSLPVSEVRAEQSVLQQIPFLTATDASFITGAQTGAKQVAYMMPDSDEEEADSMRRPHIQPHKQLAPHDLSRIVRQPAIPSASRTPSYESDDSVQDSTGGSRSMRASAEPQSVPSTRQLQPPLPQAVGSFGHGPVGSLPAQWLQHAVPAARPGLGVTAASAFPSSTQARPVASPFAALGAQVQNNGMAVPGAAALRLGPVSSLPAARGPPRPTAGAFPWATPAASPLGPTGTAPRPLGPQLGPATSTAAPATAMAALGPNSTLKLGPAGPSGGLPSEWLAGYRPPAR